jgi:hypothetical protein
MLSLLTGFADRICQTGKNGFLQCKYEAGSANAEFRLLQCKGRLSAGEISASSDRVCSCQVLNMESPRL